MRNWKLNISLQMIQGCVLAVLLVFAATALFALIGRSLLGEGVIALLYLVPIGWSTTRWGQLAGMSAAIAAFLNFNFFFIPPYYTLMVENVEGWLLLIIFLAVATVIVGRIQYGLARAHTRERDALYMYELSTALAGTRTPEEVARALAVHLQQMLSAALAQVVVETDQPSGSIMVSAPSGGSASNPPDRILPMLATRGLVGEIRIWRGRWPLPAGDGILLQNFAEQGTLAIERTQRAEAELQALRNRVSELEHASQKPISMTAHQ